VRSNSEGWEILIQDGIVRLMAGELDDIRANAECPKCGKPFSVSYKTLRLGRSIECQGCGKTIRLEDDTTIGDVQRLMDEEDAKRRPL